MSVMQELVIRVNGEIQESNFETWKSGLINQIKSANKELKTDDDFVTADATVKDFKAAEAALVQAKGEALQQAEDIQQLFDAIDEISDETRQARLGLEKQIKTRKEQIKFELVDAYANKVSDYYYQLSVNYPAFKKVKPQPFKIHDELRGSVKGLKTVKSMEQKLSDKSDDLIDVFDSLNSKYQENSEVLQVIDESHKSLFQDEVALLIMDSELLQATIDKRIATHEAEELKRKQAEAERLAEEEHAASLVDKTPEVSETVASEGMQQQDQITESRPPVADAQDINKNPDLTGGSDQGNSQAVQTGAINQAESFLMQVQIVAERDDAIAVAQLIEKQFSDDDRVVKIKLGRGEI